MEYKIIFRGRLKANASGREKGAIREEINNQIRSIWDSGPYKNLQVRREREGNFDNLLVSVGGVNYLPLITKEIKIYCHLCIELYTQKEMRSVFNDGDLDNRLKTLFDGIRAPSHEQEITFEEVGKTYYTILEDDNLIKGIKIEANQIFTEEDDFYIITIVPKREMVTFENMEL